MTVDRHVRDPHAPRCYACTVRVERAARGNVRTFEVYEDAVEWIENRSLGESFGAVDVWNGVGRGITAYHITRRVLTDMTLHGLVCRVERGVYVKII